VEVDSNIKEKQDEEQTEQAVDMEDLVNQVLAKLNEEGQEELQDDDLNDISVDMQSASASQ